MAVKVLRDERVYHAATSQFHELKAGQIIEGDFANFLEQNTRDLVEPTYAPATLAGAELPLAGSADQGAPGTVAEGSTDPNAPTGIGTDAVLTPDAYLSPLSLENSLQRQGAAYFSPDTSLPPGTPDPVQLMNDGRSGMARTVPVTVSVDPAAVPGSGNPLRARTQIEGRQPSGSNIVSENGSDEGSGVVVVPTEPYNAVLVEPVTSGASVSGAGGEPAPGTVVSQSAPLIEGAATSATAVDGETAAGAKADGVVVEDAPAPPEVAGEAAQRSEPNPDPDPKLGEQNPAGDSSDDPAGEFNPADHNGKDVIAYAEAHPDEKPRLLELERQGKGRTTVINALS